MTIHTANLSLINSGLGSSLSAIPSVLDLFTKARNEVLTTHEVDLCLSELSRLNNGVKPTLTRTPGREARIEFDRYHHYTGKDIEDAILAAHEDLLTMNAAEAAE